MKDTYCSVCGIKMGTCPDDWEGGGICQDCCPTCRRPVGQTQLDTLRSLVREMGKIIEYIETHGIEHFKPEIQKRIADALNCPEVRAIMEGRAMSNSHENQGDWICPNCGPILSVCVTYEETCTHCHCPVFWVDENHVLISKDELSTQTALLAECRERLNHWAYMFKVVAEDKITSALLPKLETMLKEKP